MHRDIKPDNVLISHDVAVVTDFGIARALSAARTVSPDASTSSSALTATGTSLGTPAYMAPEQAAGDPALDHRADIYSFGILAYELLAGEPPFGGRALHALLAAHLTERPSPLDEHRPDLPLPLVQLVHSCLEKSPSERPQSAAAVVRALDDLPITGGPPSGESPIAAPPIVPEVHVGAAASASVARRRRLGAGVTSALAVLAAGGATFWLTHRPPASRPPAAASTSATPTSLAVLPLVNVGRDSADEYFSDGMTDELTDALSRVPGLRVASRTSAFAYKGKHADARDIARALNVGALLEGRVRRDGQRLRVSAQLTSGNDGLALWSDAYERELADIFAVQDEIAAAITNALRVRLGGANPGAGTGSRRGTTDLAAYDLYLRGRFLFHQRGDSALRKAARYFEQAIALDSRFARAYAGLADAAALLPVYGDTPADSAFEVARVAAERAVALDDSLAEAHTTLGLVHKNLAQWEESEREFRRALVLDPNDASAHQWLGEVLLIAGRVAPAIDALRRAEELDPASPVIAGELAYVLPLGSDTADWVAQGRRAIALAPQLWMGHAFLGCAFIWDGRLTDAVAELETALRLDPRIPFAGALAYAYGKQGQSSRARAVLRELEAHGRERNGSPAQVALAYLGLGERDRALEWLARAVTARDPFLYSSPMYAPWFDDVRSDPRFTSLVRQMGLDPSALAYAAAHRASPLATP